MEAQISYDTYGFSSHISDMVQNGFKTEIAACIRMLDYTTNNGIPIPPITLIPHHSLPSQS